MPFKRLHSHGLEIIIHLESSQHEWWLVQVKSGLDQRSTLNLSMAQALGDRVARVDHLCNEQCGD